MRERMTENEKETQSRRRFRIFQPKKTCDVFFWSTATNSHLEKRNTLQDTRGYMTTRMLDIPGEKVSALQMFINDFLDGYKVKSCKSCFTKEYISGENLVSTEALTGTSRWKKMVKKHDRNLRTPQESVSHWEKQRGQHHFFSLYHQLIMY